MNQCDGCLRRLPLKDGIHYIESKPEMVCTREIYMEQTEYDVDESLDFTHGEPLENCSPHTVISSHPEDEE